MNNETLRVLIPILAQMHNEVLHIRAINDVLLEEVAKQSGSKVEKLREEVESMYAQNKIASDKAIETLIKNAVIANPSDRSYIEDFLGRG